MYFLYYNIKSREEGQNDRKYSVMRLSEREFCSRHMQWSGDTHPWYIDC